MEIIRCTAADADRLALLNRQLIEDEKSDNRMTVDELRERMLGFLAGEYHAYFFTELGEVLGYALVRYTDTPVYVRQFLIDRRFRRQHKGKQAFELLLRELGTRVVDLEVLSWNEAGRRFWESCGFEERSRYLRRRAEP